MVELYLSCAGPDIRQMTPYISESVMKRLPSLPKQHALIFGNSANLPTTFKVRDVHPRPKSDDAAIRELWFRAEGEAVELALAKAAASNQQQVKQSLNSENPDDEIPFG